MRTEKINNITTVYIFNDIPDCSTNVFLIEKKSKFYLIDTFCGSDSMEPILKDIKANSLYKDMIIINTHFHWDHVWGNCCFKDKTIIAHQICRELLDTNWESQINENKQYVSGLAKKKLPNLSFQERLLFHDDGIEIFYSPGHTVDSISVFDHQEEVLYVGDNLEKPIVYVENNDIPTYINTLEDYLKYDAKMIMAGHTLDITKKDIFSTIEYLQSLLAGKEMIFASQYENQIHHQNLKMV